MSVPDWMRVKFDMPWYPHGELIVKALNYTYENDERLADCDADFMLQLVEMIEDEFGVKRENPSDDSNI